jgi:protein tyrosine phosphatase (PTP) superfamily phosphohydrolase (DUF442 family)
MIFTTPARATVLALALMAHLAAAADDAAPTPIELPGIHNAFRVTAHLISGSQPEGDAAFAELARLGVKTIVSVDGAKPDVAAARKYGLRYIHLPFGYDGLPAERVAELARATATSTGPVFVHCHHGKHRGPAAIGVICEATEGWTPERAEAWLRQAGTADDYPGLYRAVREFQAVPEEQLARIGELPEVAKTPGLVDAMVALDERFDLLKTAQQAGWKTPPGAAAHSPAHEATLLWEQLRELARTEETAQRSADYRTRLTDAEQAANALRTALRGPSFEASTLDAAFQRADQSCADCHKTHRNEKK